MSVQDLVADFHRKYFVFRLESPDIPPSRIVIGRLRLLQEELSELTKAFHEDNIIEVADALADLAYIVYGTADICGIQLDPVITEVHKSNMTKTSGSFKPIKGPQYVVPNIGKVLNEQ